MSSRKTRVKVNKNVLDDECEKQSSLFLEAADNVSSLMEEKANLEQDITEAEAKAAQRYRLEPMKYLGIERATDKAILEKLNTNKKINKMRRDLISLRFQLDKANNLKAALEQKRSMIKYLSELWMDGFWSDVNVKASDEADIRMRTKKQRRKEKEDE